MRFSALFLFTAALPAILTANAVPIGLSTNSVDFTATAGAAGVIKIGNCSTDCQLDGADILHALPFAWSLKSDGALTYSSSGTPDVYALSGSTSAFLLTDKKGDSIQGTISWNTATVEATAPAVRHNKKTTSAASSSVTDLNGTLTLGAVDFVSDTDRLAEDVIAAFGSLPTSGEIGSLDLKVSCAPETCISANTSAADLLEPGSRRHQHALNNDPLGPVQSAELSFNALTAVPEPGTLFVLPALFLGGLILRKRQQRP